ncbi:MAG: efflux RND transporter permease subunit [Planctomycetota bacterium]
MNLPRASVGRPVFTAMVTLIVVVLGVFSIGRLRIDLLPPVETPTLTISTEWEGASPEVMERLVTQILEEILATVPGVEELTSTSSEGNTRIRVTFGWGTDVDAASAEVRATLANELEELPDEITRPQVRKFDVNSFPIVILGVSSPLDPVQLTQIIDDQVRYRFARIAGVAQVDTWGAYTREVRVELDPARVRALALPLNDILGAIRDANLDLPAGEIDAGRYEVTLRAPAEFRSLDDIREVIIAVREGAPVTLGQIAQVRDTYQELSRLVRVNGNLGLRIAVRKQADANTVEVSKAILDEIDRVNRDLPMIEIVPISNQGNFIERSIQNVANSVLYGGGLAVLVLLFFLRNIRSTLAISLAIPISVIGTFAMIFFGGFTLNLMTLGGLALGVGMMVDSSIVVLENIYRRSQEEGLSPREAAVKGAVEVGPAITASTLTTLVIFLPIVFVQGVSGVLFRELAYVIAFSLVVSLVVSLTVVPVLASKLLKPASNRHDGVAARLAASATRMFTALDDAYHALLRVVLRVRVLSIFATLLLLAASLSLVPSIGTEFLPPSDEGEVRVSGEMEVGTRLDLLDQQTRLIEELALPAVPEKTGWVTSVGASGWNPGAGGRGSLTISLPPAIERDRSNAEIASDLRERLEGRVPGMQIRTRAPQGQFVLDRILGGDEGLTIEVRGFDLDVLGLLCERAAEAIENIEGVTDIEVSRNVGTPQEELLVNRAIAADLGVSVRDIAEAIETAVAGSRAGEFRPEGNSYRILVQLENARNLTVDEILDLTVRSDAVEDVALRNLVSTESTRGPTVIERKDQQRLFTVRGNIAGRDMGAVAADVEAALAEIPKPTGYEMMLSGNVEEQRKASNELVISLALALALVYMVLACQYESLRDPVIVMTSVPLAAIGVVLTLYITNTTLNIQSYIGCIMLGGIVVNNAILLVDQAGQLRRQGMITSDALAEAGRRRLRPILMTSLTTMLGLMPLALGIGEGADAQAPLARAVVGGLASSMLTTLILVPAVYSLFHPPEAHSSATDKYAVDANPSRA